MKIGSLLLRQLCIVFSLVLCVSVAGAALAQSYPNKPIRIIVPYAPGGGTDQLARIVGLKLEAAFGQTVIVDNRAGGGGIIGTELAAKASPDGYTLVVVSASEAINPSLNLKIPWDPVKDFAPITQATANPYILVVHVSVPAKTVKELIAFAKSKKGGITYAVSGIGSAGHLGMELLKTLAGFDAVSVPYKGAGPAIIDLIAGQTDAYIVGPLVAMPHVRTGKLRALATTSLERVAVLPDIPTVAEAGFPGYEVSGWYGFSAPAGTPREVVAKLYKEISRSLTLPDVRDRMMANGQEPVGSTPEKFAAYIKAEMIKWEKVIKQSGAKAE